MADHCRLSSPCRPSSLNLHFRYQFNYRAGQSSPRSQDAVRAVRRHRPRHPPCRRRGPGRDQRPLLRGALRGPPGAAARPLQPRQPGLRHPAPGPGGRLRRLRHATRRAAGRAARHDAEPHRAQARLPGHRPRAVPRRPRAPLRRHRRGAGRGGHPRGRGRLDRRLLADGERAHRHREAAVRGERGHGRWRGMARLGGRRTRRGDRGRRHLPAASGRRLPRTGLPARPVRLRTRRTARRGPPDTPVQPGRRPRLVRTPDRGEADPRRYDTRRRGLEPPPRARARRQHGSSCPPRTAISSCATTTAPRTRPCSSPPPV